MNLSDTKQDNKHFLHGKSYNWQYVQNEPQAVYFHLL